MELYRISRTDYQDDLTGWGAYRHGGRWNSPGNNMLYTSSRRSLAMLEVLVHLNKSLPPPDYVVVVLYVPDAIASIIAPYPISDWEFEQQWSKEVGDDWLKEKKSLLMRVPSVVVPAEQNFLINPMHPEAGAIQVVDKEPFEFDKRLYMSFLKK